MAEYISREAVINITAETGAWETQNRVRELPATGVQPVNQWISVKDRLPETGKNVLVYYPKWKGNEIQVAHLMYNRTMFSIDGIRISVENITHWQPLPEPPKDGEQDG